MCFSLKLFLWVFIRLHPVCCQIITVPYFYKQIRGVFFYAYNCVNYLTKHEMVDAILKDYNGIPSCCLYMQGIQFEKSTNPHMKRTSLPSEQVVAHRKLETSQTSCSVKKRCKSKYQIKAHYINGRVVYECAGLYFLNFVYAIDFVKRKQNRRVNFSVEESVSFKKNEPPNRVNIAVRKSRIRSKSIAQV